MKEKDFWDAVNPYLEQEGIITISNLQIALGLSEEEAEKAAAHFCEKRLLCRVVTRHSWGYISIDPNEELPQRYWCAGVRRAERFRRNEKKQ